MEEIFTKDEWIDILLRSVGMEPTQLEEKVKWHLLARMIPLVENNYNLCELGQEGQVNLIYIRKYHLTLF